MTSETPDHQPTYDEPHQSETDQQFYCRVRCSCGAFQRTAKSKVSGTKARGNARSGFTRHAKAASAEETEPAESPRPAEADEPLPTLTLLKAERSEEPSEPSSEEPSEPSSEEPRDEPRTAAEQPPLPLSRRPALLMAAGFVAVLLALIVGIVAINLAGSDGDASAHDPTDREVTLPDLKTKAEYGRYLREADPVFAPIKDASLTVAGKRVCRQYSVGLNVVEITSSMIGRGVVNSRQARVLISAAVPVFCPRYSEPIRRELSGLA